MHCCAPASAALKIVARQQSCDLLTKADVDLTDRHHQGDAQPWVVVAEEIAEHLLFPLAPSVQRSLVADLADLVCEDVRVVAARVRSQALEPLDVERPLRVILEHPRCPVVCGAILRLGWSDSHELVVLMNRFGFRNIILKKYNLSKEKTRRVAGRSRFQVWSGLIDSFALPSASDDD